MSNQQWMPQISSRQCTGCGDCIAACPTGALAKRNNRAVLTQPQLCTYCSVCEDICPTGAIELPYQISFAQDNRPNERYG